MISFPALLRLIRKEANMTQEQFADFLNVSAALIAMIETGQKAASKKLVFIVAEKLHMHPASLMPFLGISENEKVDDLSAIERKLFEYGEKLQKHIITKRARHFRT